MIVEERLVLLFGALQDGGAVTIGAADDKLTFTFEPLAPRSGAGPDAPTPDQPVKEVVS